MHAGLSTDRPVRRGGGLDVYGDTAQVRAQGTRLRAVADGVRSRAGDVVAAGDISWVSAAADRYRDELAARSSELQRVADEIDQAAAALARHAAGVEKVKAAIEAAERWVLHKVAEAHSVVASAVDTAVDAVIDAVTSFFHRARNLLATVRSYDPLPGSLDWLELRDVVARL